MRFPRFKSRQRNATLNSHNETVFAEASELSQRRLVQCIADLHTRVAAMSQAEDQDEQKLGGCKSVFTHPSAE